MIPGFSLRASRFMVSPHGSRFTHHDFLFPTQFSLSSPNVSLPSLSIHCSLFTSRDVSSAGSERMLHTHEVDGSIPLRPTDLKRLLEISESLFYFIGET